MDEIDNINNDSDGKLFNQKATVKEKTRKGPVQFGKPGDANRPTPPPVPILNVEVTIPLKCLDRNQRFHDFPLIKCEIELHLA